MSQIITQTQDRRSQDKVLSYEVFIDIQKPAAEVFDLLTHNFSDVYKYANGVIASERRGDILDGQEGCRRLCYLNTSKMNFMEETLEDLDEKAMSFTNVITACGNIPMVPNVSKSWVKVSALNAARCRLSCYAEYRTKPYFLGVLLKRVFKNTMMDYLISVNHYMTTGEVVRSDNYKGIKKHWKRVGA